MGGRHQYSAAAWAEKQKEWRQEAKKRFREQSLQRQTLADKIVSMVIDQVNQDVIRPGPVSEERECYAMAGELREHKTVLMDLVAQILTAEHIYDLDKMRDAKQRAKNKGIGPPTI